MMNFYGMRKTNSESEFRADSKTNKGIAKRISNYELARGSQSTNNSGSIAIDRLDSFDLLHVPFTANALSLLAFVGY